MSSRTAVLLRASLLLCFTSLLLSAAGRPRTESKAIKAVRFWSLGEITRVVIETSGEVSFKSDRVPNPDRIFFDLAGVRPSERKIQTILVGDKLLKQIRIAETVPGTTRVVFDLAGPAEFTSSQLTVPDRIIVELRSPGQSQASALPPIRSTSGQQTIAEGPVAANAAPANDSIKPASAPQPGAAPSMPPPVSEPKEARMPAELRPAVDLKPAIPEATPAAGKRTPLAPVAETTSNVPAPAAQPGRSSDVVNARAAAAKRDSRGDRSLIRALGLKLDRVVLDPGHGGHDTGTIGPTGYTEKDLVLDVAKRLGALIRQRLGSEVIYTRSDDTFIPLETRTEIANDHHADLFLSIHANSSPVTSTAGPETFYMNLSSSPADLEVAARENASSSKSIFELQDLIQKITANEKVQESREFAATVQKAAFTGWARGRRGVKDRGVKKAPFVVLIHAKMPSVLAEIAFLSNPREERLLRRSDYRQRIAEALFKGVSEYASTLSHFEMAGVPAR